MKWKLTFLLILICGTAWGQVLTVFSEDFEGTGFLRWEPLDIDPGHVYWHRKTGTVTYLGTSVSEYDGAYWWCGVDSLNGYVDSTLQYLITPDIVLPSSPTGPIIFEFMTNVKIETPATEPTLGTDAWDSYNVRISTDGGLTFSVIEPTGDYPFRSCYGFNFNEEPLDSIPGWANSTTGWEKREIDLSSYAGDTVMISIVFGSDPMASAGDTTDAFNGLFVDNIIIHDDVDTCFEDYANDTLTMLRRDGKEHTISNTFRLTTLSSHSPTHAIHAPQDSNCYFSIITPEIAIPDTFIGRVNFAVKCDMPDYDGDGDNMLEDYFMILIWRKSTGIWSRLMYDYKRDGNRLGIGDWTVLDHEDSLFDIAGRVDNHLQLYDSAGVWIMNDTIRLLFWAVYDDDNNGGMGEGLFFDDVTVTGTRGKLKDIQVDTMFTSPINKGQQIRFTVRMKGLGAEPAPAQGVARIYRLGGTIPISGANITVPGNLGYNEYKLGSFLWRPTSNGDYFVKAWTTYFADEDRSNDTSYYYFSIRDDWYIESGFDDGSSDTVRWTRIDTLTHDTAYFYTEGYAPGLNTIHSFGIGQIFATPCITPPCNGSYIQDIKLKVYGEGQFLLGFYEGWNGTFPPDDPEFSWTITIPSPIDPQGEWVELVLPDSEWIPWDTFGIAACKIDTPIHWGVCADTNSFNGKVYVGFDVAGGFPSWTRLDSVMLVYTGHPWVSFPGTGNLLIRVNIFDNNNITEIPLPEKIALEQNYPNPFNPITAINFSLPEVTDVQLLVYDVSGRVVNHLLNQSMNQGRHIVIWNGKNDMGSDVPSGLYFYKLITPEQVMIKKMTMVR